MRNEYSYGMKQIQKLAMTKEMQMSINILQMSSAELSEYIEKEFVSNPLIEISDNSVSNIKEYGSLSSYGKVSINSEDISPLNFVSKEKTLKEYLHEQILEVEKDKKIRKTADYIVECLDDNGYFKVNEKVVAEELKITVDEVEKSLRLVQKLEPVGIGAKSLRECLIIQLDYLNINEPKLIQIISNNLEDIGKDNYKKIAKELSITRAEVQRYSEMIRKLEPRPSRGFYTGEDYKYIVPDAEIRKTDFGLEILMSERSVPSLIISSTYKKILQEKGDLETEKYVKERMEKAQNLIKSIQERKNTLRKILECVTSEQYDYFCGKVKFLKPMMIKDVAKELNCSESTVSRAVKDKFVLTEKGIVKVKELFTLNSIKCNNNEFSVSFIKNIIESLIEKENKKSPIPDQDIADNLKEKGIKISRRTVAKYREEMGIKSSHKRKIL